MIDTCVYCSNRKDIGTDTAWTCAECGKSQRVPMSIEQCRGIVELVLLRALSSVKPASREQLAEMVQRRVDLCLREEPGTGDLA